MTEITTDELDGARHVVAAALANTFADLGDREPLLEDVDRCAALLKEMNATIVRGPMEGGGRRAITTCCSRTLTASG